jgi:hypothetical protein
MKCINPECFNEKILARGYCCPCYHRLKKRGTLARINVVNSGQCKAEGCQEKAFSKNLCSKHYLRAEHPLKQPWKNLRSRYPGQFPTSWDKFEAFIADVPTRPDGDYQLRRARADEPWSATNMFWLATLRSPETQDQREYHSEYGKTWSDERKYGVSRERRDEMFKEQGGKCAICRKPESMVNPRHPERKPRRMSIDHDHRTLKVRGLLCGRCNTMIGRRGADDSIETLRAAIAYLEKHAAPLSVPAKQA